MCWTCLLQDLWHGFMANRLFAHAVRLMSKMSWSGHDMLLIFNKYAALQRDAYDWAFLIIQEWQGCKRRMALTTAAYRMSK